MDIKARYSGGRFHSSYAQVMCIGEGKQSRKERKEKVWELGDL